MRRLRSAVLWRIARVLDGAEDAAFRYLAWRGEHKARAASAPGGATPTPHLRARVVGWLDRAAEATR